MSRALRCLRSPLQSLSSTPSRSTRSSSTLHTRHRVGDISTREYGQTALKARGDAAQTPSPPLPSDRVGGQLKRDPVWGLREKFGEAAQPLPLSKIKQEPRFAHHLNALFEPLQFNPEVARRCLTHGSHPTSINGHNAGMSFLGRRVLESYLLLFLHSSPNLRPAHDLTLIANWTLATYVIGQHVGSKWGLGRMMRWVPTAPKEKLAGLGEKDELLRSVGLYKVQGDAVAAVMGAIYEQFGASVAHRAFHTRLLPHLLLDGKNGGLPLVFHDEVQAICEQMGGAEGNLMEPHGTEAETKTTQ